MKRHIRTHTGDKPYKCNECGTCFSDKRNLHRHTMTHEGKKPFECKECDAKFGQLTDLNRHEMSHSGLKPFKCDVCNASFSRSSNLKWHKLTHEGETPHTCPTCKAGFKNIRDIKQHLKTNHSDAKPFACGVCGLATANKFALLRHCKTHTGVRPYRCKECVASFMERSTLKRHEMRHRGIKPYKCTMCNSAFLESRVLKRHRVTVHGENRFQQDASDPNKIYITDSNQLLDTVKREVNDLNRSVNTEIQQADSLISSQNAINIVSGVANGGKNVINTDPTMQLSNAPFDHINKSSSGGSNNTSAAAASFGDGSFFEITSGAQGDNHIPTLVLTQPGQPSKAYHLAGDCQNHQNHVLTFLEGSANQWQTWCLCNPHTVLGNDVINNSTNSGNLTGVNEYYAPTVPSNNQQQPGESLSNSAANIATINDVITTEYVPRTTTTQNVCGMQQFEYASQYTSQSTSDPNGNQVFTGFVANESQVNTVRNNTSDSLYLDSFEIRYPSDISGREAQGDIGNAEHKPNVANVSKPANNTQSSGNSQSLQYRLTVNNPVTGNIQITSEPLIGDITQEIQQPNKSGNSLKKKYQCPICSKTFLRNMHLMTHMRRHTGEKPFKCHLCEACFPHSNTLTAHIRSHTGEKPYVCKVCKASFTQKSNLTAHQRIHTGEKPYRCGKCNMGFRQASHLPTHMRTHSKERPFPCRKCEKRFTQRSALKRHIKVHERSKPNSSFDQVPCKKEVSGNEDEQNLIGNKEVSSKENYQEHIKSLPKSIFICTHEDCGLKCTSEKALQKHTFLVHTNVYNFSVTENHESQNSINDANSEKLPLLLDNNGNSEKDDYLRSIKLVKKTVRRKKKNDHPQEADQKQDSKPSKFGNKKRNVGITAIRSSARIKEASVKIKNSSLDSDFITGDLSDIETEEFIVPGPVKHKTTRGLLLDNLEKTDMRSWCFCEVPHGPDQPHSSACNDGNRRIADRTQQHACSDLDNQLPILSNKCDSSTAINVKMGMDDSHQNQSAQANTELVSQNAQLNDCTNKGPSRETVYLNTNNFISTAYTVAATSNELPHGHTPLKEGPVTYYTLVDDSSVARNSIGEIFHVKPINSNNSNISSLIDIRNANQTSANANAITVEVQNNIAGNLGNDESTSHVSEVQNGITKAAMHSKNLPDNDKSGNFLNVGSSTILVRGDSVNDLDATGKNRTNNATADNIQTYRLLSPVTEGDFIEMQPMHAIASNTANSNLTGTREIPHSVVSNTNQAKPILQQVQIVRAGEIVDHNGSRIEILGPERSEAHDHRFKNSANITSNDSNHHMYTERKNQVIVNDDTAHIQQMSIVEAENVPIQQNYDHQNNLSITRETACGTGKLLVSKGKSIQELNVNSHHQLEGSHRIQPDIKDCSSTRAADSSSTEINNDSSIGSNASSSVNSEQGAVLTSHIQYYPTENSLLQPRHVADDSTVSSVQYLNNSLVVRSPAEHQNCLLFNPANEAVNQVCLCDLEHCSPLLLVNSLWHGGIANVVLIS